LQINGLFHALVIFIRVLFINIPVPLSTIFGQTFCQWIDMPNCVYLIGSVTWSFFISLYRVLYVKAQNCLRIRIGENRFLRFG
jgi:hypothetical protein